MKLMSSGVNDMVCEGKVGLQVWFSKQTSQYTREFLVQGIWGGKYPVCHVPEKSFVNYSLMLTSARFKIFFNLIYLCLKLPYFKLATPI